VKKKMLAIIIVFLAGAKTEVWWWNWKISSWPGLFWLTWPFMKWWPFRTIFKIFGIKTRFLNELKCESIARIERAIHEYKYGYHRPVAGDFDKIIIPDSDLPSGIKSVGTLALEYMVSRGISKEQVVVIGKAVGTSEKCDAVRNYLDSIDYIKNYDIRMLYPVTTDYNAERVFQGLKKKVSCEVIAIYVNWKKIKHCLKEEMLYNLVTEGMKTWVDKHPQLQKIFSNFERRSRKKNK